jgi:hypothetical protein
MSGGGWMERAHQGGEEMEDSQSELYRTASARRGEYRKVIETVENYTMGTVSGGSWMERAHQGGEE